MTASAAAAPVNETLPLVPAESVLTFDLLLTEAINTTQGSVDVTYDISGASGTAGITALTGALVDPVDEFIDFGGGSGLSITAPAGAVTLSAVTTGSTANAVTALGGGAFTFDQAGIDLDLAGVLTIGDGTDSFTTDLADVGTLTGQVVDDAVLSFLPGGTRLEAPIMVSFLLPLGDGGGGGLPISVAGTLVAGVGQAGLDGDYNDTGLVEQGDLDLVLANWGASFSAVPPAWINQRPTEGIVDQAELDGVLANWGATAAPDLRGTPMPEPAAAVLLGGLGVGRRRSRERRGVVANSRGTTIPRRTAPLEKRRDEST